MILTCNYHDCEEFQNSDDETKPEVMSASCRLTDGVSTGDKRKYDQIDDNCENIVPCLEHRQKLFNLSMGKLQVSTLRREPCLRRSVLIFNTLRRIEGDNNHILNNLDELTARTPTPEPLLNLAVNSLDNNNYARTEHSGDEEEDNDIIMTDISRTIHLQTANQYASFFDMDTSTNQQNHWLDVTANSMLNDQSPDLLTPLSADELLNALPSPVECGKSASYCVGGQTCDDLDHIMQVIVGN